MLREMIASIPHARAHEISFLRTKTSSVGCSHSSKTTRASFFKSRDAALTLFGEVFNLNELKTRMPELRSSGDENLAYVLFHYYRKFGPNGLRDVDGTCAIAVLDESLRKCFLVADPLGITPLFYATPPGSNTLIFSTHVNALFQYRDFSTEIDRVTLLERKALGFHDARRTYFKDIKQVATNSLLEIPTEQIANMTSRRNEDPPASKNGSQEDPEEWLTQCERLLLRALDTRSARYPDQPLRLAFSGGIDSSLLATLLRRNPARGLTCFTMLDCKEAQDASYARLVAETLNLKHQLCQITLQQFGESLPDLISVMGCHGPIFAPYFLAKTIRESDPAIPMFFCGEGAEDYLARDTTFVYFILKKMAQRLTEFEPRAIEKSPLLRTIRERLARDIQPEQSDELLQLIEPFETGSFYSLRAASDALGLECAFPFADKQLAAFAATIPQQMRTNGNVPNLVPRLLLTRNLRDRDLCTKLLSRPKEPIFFALWHNLNSLGRSLKETLPQGFLYRNKYSREARHVLDLFWIWGLEVVFLKYRGQVGGMTFDDLIREIIVQYEQRGN